VIKLTQRRTGERETVIHVDGRLDGDSLGDLLGLVRSRGSADAVTLDLSGLVSVDPAGQAALVALRAMGCRLLGGSLYVNRLLEEVEP
jgi:anti-anti-sigma regulatory factor